MQPESLAKYKLQVYNPGSPFPSPKSDPLKAFPTIATATADPENPLKITFSTKKRKHTSVSEAESDSPRKKSKMMNEEQIKALFKDLKDENKQTMDTFKEDFAKQLASDQAEITKALANITTQLGTIVSQQSEATQTAKETDARIKAIEDRLDNVENNQGKAVNEDNATPSESSWIATLAKEVFDHEHGLIIHGIKLDGHNDQSKKAAIMKFFKEELKASEDLLSKIRIRDVCRLGSDTGSGKLPPILVKLGHPTERNQLLPLSSNLKRGVDIDKSVPKLYLKTHKEFKRHAWKLKLLHNVQTQVVFEGHNMILRYRKKADGVMEYNWETDREWFPKPSDLAASLQNTKTKDPNKHDTPKIDTTSAAQCSRAVIISGVPESVRMESAISDFKNYFKNEDHARIAEIQYKSKGVTVLVCTDWDSAKYIANTYKKSKFAEKEIYFTLFSETDPSLRSDP